MNRAKIIIALVSALFPTVIVCGVAIYLIVSGYHADSERHHGGFGGGFVAEKRIADYVPVVVSIIAVFSTLASTISTMWLAWRAERRGTREFEIKIEKLELELREARSKAAQISN